MDNKIHELINEICDLKDEDITEYLTMLKNESDKKLNEMKKNETKIMLDESLNDHLENLFEDSIKMYTKPYHDKTKPFDEVYKTGKNIKNLIKKIKVVSFDLVDDDQDSYIDVDICFDDKITLSTYVQSMAEGMDHVEINYFVITCDGLKYVYGNENIEDINDCDLFEKGLRENIINTSYNDIINNKKNSKEMNEINFKKMYKCVKKDFKNKETFKNFLKLLITIPQIWYAYIY